MTTCIFCDWKNVAQRILSFSIFLPVNLKPELDYCLSWELNITWLIYQFYITRNENIDCELLNCF